MEYLDPKKVDEEYPYFIDEFGEPAFVIGVKNASKPIRSTYSKDDYGDWIKETPQLKMLPLYNLRATIKNRKLPVIFVDTEREADFLTEKLGDRYIFVCCKGGFAGATTTDLKPILDRNLFIIPPPDHYGKIEAGNLCKMLVAKNSFLFADIESNFGNKDLVEAWPIYGKGFHAFVSMALKERLQVQGRLRQDQAARAFLFANVYHPTNKGIIFLNGQWFVFNGRNYEPASKDAIINMVLEYFESVGQISICTSSFLNSLMTHIRARLDFTHKDSKFWIEPKANALKPKKIITLKDGLYRIRSSGKMQKVSGFTSKFFDTTCLEITFDEKAKCPKWIAFLEDILPDKSDRILLQEWFGYHFCHTLQLRKYMSLLGKGSNGKSVVNYVLRLMLGRENCSSMDLDAFSKEFHLAGTFGKIANVSDELPSTMGKLNDGLLKKFMAGEAIFFNPKGEKGFTANVTAKWTQACNELPTTTDTSNGVIDRTIIIRFKKRTEEKDKNFNLIQDHYWEPELTGILNWTLEGTTRIIKNRKFTLVKKHVKELDELRTDSTPEVDWLTENYYECEQNIKQGAVDLYNLYRGEQRTNGVHERYFITPRRFKNAIETVFPNAQISDNKVTFNNKRQKIWTGISTKPSRDLL